MPANLVRVATGRAWPVVPGPGRVKRGARIVRSCCLVCVAQLLPVAAWAVGRAAWFAVICWPVTAARAVICCQVNAAAAVIRAAAAWSACLVPVATGRAGRAAAAWCLDLVPVAAWSRSCCLVRVCVCVPGRSVFVIRCLDLQTLGPRCLVRDPWPACLAAWSVAHGPRALARK